MRKLSLTLLAASTMLLAGVATAQPAGGPRPGATWRGGTMGGNVQMRGGGMQMHGGNMQMHGRARTGGGFQAHGGSFQMGGGNWRHHRWSPRPGHDFRYSRLRSACRCWRRRHSRSPRRYSTQWPLGTHSHSGP